MRTLRFLTIVLVLALSACAHPPATPTPSPASPLGRLAGDWALTALGRDGFSLPLPAGLAALSVDGERLVLRAGCLGVGAGLTASETALTLEDISLSPLGDCAPAPALEEALRRALPPEGSVTYGYILDGDGLRVITAEGDLRFERS